MFRLPLCLDCIHRYPADAVRMMGDLGLMGVDISEEDGGAGVD